VAANLLTAIGLPELSVQMQAQFESLAIEPTTKQEMQAAPKGKLARRRDAFVQYKTICAASRARLPRLVRTELSLSRSRRHHRLRSPLPVIWDISIGSRRPCEPLDNPFDARLSPMS
jgi:hypothetical protein